MALQQWSKNYDSCINCKLQTRPYGGLGLCKLCYSQTPAQRERHRLSSNRYSLKVAEKRKEYWKKPEVRNKHRQSVKKYKQSLKGRLWRINYDHRRRPHVSDTDVTRDWLLDLWNKSIICPVCGSALSTNRHLDHIIPLCRGGGHVRSNLRFLCGRCNTRLGGIESGASRRLK